MDAQRLGRPFSSEEWEEIKVEQMLRIMRVKFDTVRSYRQALMSANAYIARAVGGELFWSCGLNPDDVYGECIDSWPGKNVMGRIHMFLREQMVDDFGNIVPELIATKTLLQVLADDQEKDGDEDLRLEVANPAVTPDTDVDMRLMQPAHSHTHSHSDRPFASAMLIDDDISNAEPEVVTNPFEKRFKSAQGLPANSEIDVKQAELLTSDAEKFEKQQLIKPREEMLRAPADTRQLFEPRITPPTRAQLQQQETMMLPREEAQTSHVNDVDQDERQQTTAMHSEGDSTLVTAEVAASSAEGSVTMEVGREIAIDAHKETESQQEKPTLVPGLDEGEDATSVEAVFSRRSPDRQMTSRARPPLLGRTPQDDVTKPFIDRTAITYTAPELPRSPLLSRDVVPSGPSRPPLISRTPVEPPRSCSPPMSRDLIPRSRSPPVSRDLIPVPRSRSPPVSRDIIPRPRSRSPQLSQGLLPRRPLLRDPHPPQPQSREPLLPRPAAARDPFISRDSLLGSGDFSGSDLHSREQLALLELRERERAYLVARERLRKERLLSLLERELDMIDSGRDRPLLRNSLLSDPLFEDRQRLPPTPPPVRYPLIPGPAPNVGRVMVPRSRGPLIRAPPQPPQRGRGLGRGRGLVPPTASFRKPTPVRQAAPTIDDWLYDETGKTSLESVALKIRPSSSRGRGQGRGRGRVGVVAAAGQIGEWQPVEKSPVKIEDEATSQQQQPNATEAEKTKGGICPFADITGCQMRPFKLRHLARKHLPQQLFRCAPNETQEERCARVLDFLSDLCSHLDVSNLDELLSSFTKQAQFVAEDFKVVEPARELCAHLHRRLQLALPFDEVNFHKPNCVSALAWFQNVIIMCRRLKPNCMNKLSTKYASDVHPPESNDTKNEKETSNTETTEVQKPVGQNSEMKSDGTVVKAEAEADANTEVKDVDLEEGEVDVLLGVDAFCHLDLLLAQHSLNPDFNQLLKLSTSRQLRAVIGSFSVPSLYPSKKLLEHIASDSRLRLCIGFSPSNVRKTSEAQRISLQVSAILDRCPKLVALGRVGVDFRKADEELRVRQMGVLLELSRLALERNLPVVIDCYESSTSSEKLEATQTAIAVLRKILPQSYPVYKTNVQSATEAVLWSDAFPQCIFGVNASVCRGPVSLKGLHGIIMLFSNRFVIESQAPHPFDTGVTTVSTPVTSYLAVAQRVAALMQKPVGEVVSNCNKIALRFFNIE